MDTPRFILDLSRVLSFQLFSRAQRSAVKPPSYHKMRLRSNHLSCPEWRTRCLLNTMIVFMLFVHPIASKSTVIIRSKPMQEMRRTDTVEARAHLAAVISSTPNNSSIPGYTYLGCYADTEALSLPLLGSTPQYLLSNRSYASSTIMSWAACTSYCNGYQYAGITAGSTCRCGNTFAFLTSAASDSLCQTPCTGNSLQSCGGSGRLTIFRNATFSANSPASQAGPVSSLSLNNLPVSTQSVLPPPLAASSTMRSSLATTVTSTAVVQVASATQLALPAVSLLGLGSLNLLVLPSTATTQASSLTTSGSSSTTFQIPSAAQTLVSATIGPAVTLVTTVPVSSTISLAGIPLIATTVSSPLFSGGQGVTPVNVGSALTLAPSSIPTSFFTLVSSTQNSGASSIQTLSLLAPMAPMASLTLVPQILPSLLSPSILIQSPLVTLPASPIAIASIRIPPVVTLSPVVPVNIQVSTAVGTLNIPIGSPAPLLIESTSPTIASILAALSPVVTPSSTPKSVSSVVQPPMLESFSVQILAPIAPILTIPTAAAPSPLATLLALVSAQIISGLPSLLSTPQSQQTSLPTSRIPNSVLPASGLTAIAPSLLPILPTVAIPDLPTPTSRGLLIDTNGGILQNLPISAASSSVDTTVSLFNAPSSATGLVTAPLIPLGNLPLVSLSSLKTVEALLPVIQGPSLGPPVPTGNLLLSPVATTTNVGVLEDPSVSLTSSSAVPWWVITEFLEPHGLPAAPTFLAPPLPPFIPLLPTVDGPAIAQVPSGPLPSGVLAANTLNTVTSTPDPSAILESGSLVTKVFTWTFYSNGDVQVDGIWLSPFTGEIQGFLPDGTRIGLDTAGLYIGWNHRVPYPLKFQSVVADSRLPAPQLFL